LRRCRGRWPCWDRNRRDAARHDRRTPIATSTSRPANDDEPLSDADLAAIERALNEPGITLSVDALAELLAGLDDEVRELLAVGRVAEAIGLARFNAFEATHDWNEGRSYRPCDEPPLPLTGRSTWRQ